eukprot:3619289-Amphidinium_carterae.1
MRAQPSLDSKIAPMLGLVSERQSWDGIRPWTARRRYHSRMCKQVDHGGYLPKYWSWPKGIVAKALCHSGSTRFVGECVGRTLARIAHESQQHSLGL